MDTPTKQKIISGTSFKKRVAFQEMIEKAKKGEVEYIITKSICRFARNTVDTLTTIRMLKSIQATPQNAP